MLSSRQQLNIKTKSALRLAMKRQRGKKGENSKHDYEQNAQPRISVDTNVALEFGTRILGRLVTPTELIKETRQAKRNNVLLTRGRELAFQIRLMTNDRYLSKRERDKIRHVLDEYDKLENLQQKGT